MARATLQTPGGRAEVPPDPELSPWLKAVVGSSVAADLVLRTGLATAVAAAALPWAASGAPRRERDRLRFYAGVDPAEAFAPPPSGVEVSARRLRQRNRSVDVLRFESPYRALHPELRDDYARHERNRLAWAQHWRHEDGPRPTLCVLHGFGASPYWLNSAFFALPWFYGQGYDVLLYVTPFHGRRAQPLLPLDGAGLFAHGAAHFNEAMVHAVHDFRIFLDHLEATGVRQIGVTGLSLGGYLTALLATVEPRLAFAIPNAPVVDIVPLARQWLPMNLLIAAAARVYGLDIEQIGASLALHSPLRRPPLLERDRLMVIGGLGDRLAPPEQARLLWEHWDRPRLHWYPGNHALHVNRGAYLKEMRRFIEAAGFTAPNAVSPAAAGGPA